MRTSFTAVFSPFPAYQKDVRATRQLARFKPATLTIILSKHEIQRWENTGANDLRKFNRHSVISIQVGWKAVEHSAEYTVSIIYGAHQIATGQRRFESRCTKELIPMPAIIWHFRRFEFCGRRVCSEERSSSISMTFVAGWKINAAGERFGRARRLVAVELAGAKLTTDGDSARDLAVVLSRGRRIEVGQDLMQPPCSD